MATIQFSNGVKVEFNGEPTQADIEEVARQIQSGQPQQAQQPSAREQADIRSAETTGATFPARTGEGPVSAGFKSIGNIPSSAIGTAKGLYGALRHPIETAKGVGRLALGTAQQFIPGEQGSEESFDAVVSYFKDRYGGLENAQRTATNDPFGFGADVLGLVTGAVGVAGKARVLSEIPILSKVSPAVKNVVQKSTFNLSPTQTAKLGENVNSASQWLTENNIVGSAAGRSAKAEKFIDKYENTIQRTLTKDAKDVTITKQDIVNELESLKNSPEFADDRDLVEIQRQIDGAIGRINLFPDNIPAARLNAFKRSTYKGAFNKTGEKVSDAIEFAIADKVYDRLSTVLNERGITFDGKDLVSFNKDYQSAINAKKILDITKNKRNLGFIGRLTSAGIGAYLGSLLNPIFGTAVGATVGPAIGETVAGISSAARSYAAGAGRVPAATAIPISAAGAEEEYLNQLGL